jgi:transposase
VRLGLAVGAVWNRYKVKKHFQVSITDDITYERKHEQIAQEAELDGIYVLRAGRIDPEELAAAGIVRAYKQLKEAEKGFGGMKGPLEVRPIHHRLEERVRAHLMICMLAEYVRWHLRHAWAELLFQDDIPASTGRQGHPLARGDPQGRPPLHPPTGALPHDREPVRRA